MLRIRAFTPPAPTGEGLMRAGGELIIGDARLCFLLDLSCWTVADYERQWREGLTRLARGASSSALMTSYRGPHGGPHVMWALWRNGEHVYVQEHLVLAEELDTPFDPSAPYAHVGERLRAAEHRLPIGEWRDELVHLYAAAMRIRWPFLRSR
jgi:hypothetical protein